MKSSYLINIALVIVALSLYWFLNQGLEAPKQQTISTVSQNDITEITITQAGMDPIVLKKTTANWQLSQPLQTSANNTRIKLLLSILDATSHSRLAHPDDTMLKQLGLNKTSALLQLNDQYFQFGDLEPINKRRYILHNDNIHLIDDNIMPMLKASAASFIDNKLLSLDRQLSKLIIPMISTNKTISTDNITIKQHDGHWTSEYKNVSSDQLTILINTWQHAQALQVLPLNKSKLPSTAPHKISLWYENKSEPTEFELQYDDNTLYINSISQQLSYQFPIALMQQLFPTNQ